MRDGLCSLVGQIAARFGFRYVGAEPNVRFNSFTYRASCMCGAGSGDTEFDATAIEDALDRVFFVGATLRYKMLQNGCKCGAVSYGDSQPRDAHAEAAKAFVDAAQQATEAAKTLADNSYSTWLPEPPLYKPEQRGPIEQRIDGLTVAECLARYQAWQREDVRDTAWAKTEPRKPPSQRAEYLTLAQVEVARSAWSSELRKRQAEARKKERCQVVCDIQDID